MKLIYFYSNSGSANIAKVHLKQANYAISSVTAVIIDNETFESDLNLPDRKGSNVDSSSLFQSFQELGFETDLLNDATYDDMEEKFKDSKTKNVLFLNVLFSNKSFNMYNSFAACSALKQTESNCKSVLAWL